jgi:hypothetical protein
LAARQGAFSRREALLPALKKLSGEDEDDLRGRKVALFFEKSALRVEARSSFLEESRSFLQEEKLSTQEKTLFRRGKSLSSARKETLGPGEEALLLMKLALFR